MKPIIQFEENPFWIYIVENLNAFLNYNEELIYEIEDNEELDEHQWYIHNVGFTYIHLRTWIEQLFLAGELISNFDYSGNNTYNRYDHLYYNFENYIIRYQSTPDRIFQLINSVFHLCNSSNMVNEKIITSNLLIKHHNIDSKLKSMKSLKYYEKERNEIIHRYSLLDKQLRKLEIFYSNKNLDDNFKKYRADLITKKIQETKSTITKRNDLLLKEVLELITLLFPVYKANELRLR